jgi:uncharacterized protein YbdZ (MbtH family)
MDSEQIPLAAHQIIVNELHHFVVWSARQRLPLGWHYLGKEGSRDELERYLRLGSI